MHTALYVVVTSVQLLGVIVLVGTEHTPFNLSTVISYSNLTASYVSVSAAFPAPRLSADVVIDYSYSTIVTASLKASDSQVITMWGVETGENNRYAGVFVQYLSALNLTGVRLIVDTEDVNLRMSRHLVTQFPSVFTEPVFTVPLEVTLSEVLQFTGEVIKPSGATSFAVFTSPKTAALLLSAFQTKRLNKAGYVFILSDTARYFGSGVSAVPLAQHGLLYIARADNYQTNLREAGEALILVQVWSELQAPRPEYVLVNMQNGVPVVVSPTPTSPLSYCVFPGNTTHTPSQHVVAIPVSVNNPFINPDGSLFPRGPVVMRGFSVALDEANSRRDILPNFRFISQSAPLSGLTFNSTFTYNQTLCYLEKLGLAHFAIPLGVNVISLYTILAHLNQSIPLLTGSMSDTLASKAQFPYYLRTRTGNRYLANVIAQFLKFFNWRRVAVLYTQDQFEYEEAYRDFLAYVPLLDLTITNEPGMRALSPDLLSVKGLAHLNASISHIRMTNTRIILLFTPYIANIADAMYDLEVRSEYLLLTTTALSSAMYVGPVGYKRRIVTKGAIQFFPRLFIGQKGEETLSKLVARDGQNYYPNGCLYYDCAWLYILATDYMITRGLDYEDKDEIMRAMRSSHFKGCSGTITYDKDSNEPSDQIYSILNSWTDTDQNTTSVRVAYYFNPFSVTLIEAVNPVEWPDDSQGHFLDILTYQCPFPTDQVRPFVPGTTLAFALSYFICAFTAVCVMFLWRPYRNLKYPVLLGKHEPSMDDFMHLISPVIELFQLLSIAPEWEQLKNVLRFGFELTSLNLYQGQTAIGESYWVMLYVSLSVTALITVLCLLKLLRREDKLECIPCCSFLMIFVRLFLPTAPNYVFIALLTLLLKVLFCTEATGEYWTSSFLDSDCYEQCWQGSHLTLVIISYVLVLLYVLLTLCTLLPWQNSRPLLHIKTQPCAFLLRSLVHVILLTSAVTFKSKYSDIHCVLFLVIIALYFSLTLMSPLFNYHR